MSGTHHMPGIIARVVDFGAKDKEIISFNNEAIMAKIKIYNREYNIKYNNGEVNNARINDQDIIILVLILN